MRSLTPVPASLAAATALLLVACGGGDRGEAAADGGTDRADTIASSVSDTACHRLTGIPVDSMETTSSGLGVRQVSEGQGRAAEAGDTVVAHYLGCLTDGTKFDASHDRARPISFVLGRGEVIQGWDEGLTGMRPGGVRHLRIPPELGYGARGTPDGPIPPNSTLLFEVQMVDVRPPGDESAGG
jgi:FKBP-type peptidyl-prolyl cis-trans isomerase